MHICSPADTAENFTVFTLLKHFNEHQQEHKQKKDYMHSNSTNFVNFVMLKKTKSLVRFPTATITVHCILFTSAVFSQTNNFKT